MGVIVLRRLALGLLVVWGASLVVFLVLHVIPGDPVAAKLHGAPATPEAIAVIREDLGLNEPLLQQYGSFVTGVFRGDLGESFITEQPVTTILAESIPPTLVLTIASLAIGVVLGCGLGVVAALRPDSWIDRMIRLTGSLFAAMPVFWTGVMLMTVFSFSLHWFPAIGGDGWRGLALPAASLGLASAGVLARVARSSLVEVQGEPFHVMLRAKGLPRWRILVVHAGRNALLPVLAVVGLQFGEALAGAVVTETVFSRAGVGRVLVSAILDQDRPVVQGAMVVFALGLVITNLIVDLTQAAIDPRIRTGWPVPA